MQAERITEILSHFEQGLAFFRAAAIDFRKSAGWLSAKPGGELSLVSKPTAGRCPFSITKPVESFAFPPLLFRHPFQIAIAPVQDLTIGSKDGPPPRSRPAWLVERQGAPVLTVRRQRIQAIHRGQDPRADRNLFALQTVRITLPFHFSWCARTIGTTG